jgi:hypothetical protein
MEDGVLADYLVVYIEKQYAKYFTMEMKMNYFYSMKDVVEHNLKEMPSSFFVFVHVYSKVENFFILKK